MIKRNFLLFIGFMLLIVVASPPVQAGEKEVRVDLRFAGAFFRQLAQVDSPDGVLLFQTQAQGSPGAATIMGVALGGSTDMDAGDLDGCFVGADLKLIPNPAFEPNENSLAATFNDLSILNMARDETRLAEAFNCIRFDPSFNPSRFDAFLPIKFTGGFGRFEGATGEGIITLQSVPVIPGSNFSSEIGTITGMIILP